MGIDYYIDESEGIIYEKFTGIISIGDFLDHVNKEHKDERFRLGMPTLADLTEVGGEWGYMEMIQFRNFVKEVLESSKAIIKWAVVMRISSNIGVIKLLGLLSEAVGVKAKIRIFEEKEEALKWLREK